MDYKNELIELIRERAYRKGEFKLSSGKTSEHYINCKPVTLDGEGLHLITYLMKKLIDTNVVAGLTLGADPLVAGVALTMQCSGLIVRKEPKGHGTGAWIEGPLPLKATKITVLEDVTTTGGSALKAVQRLREAGYSVDRVVTIIDREEGAVEMMKENGLELCSIITLNDLL